MALCGSRERLKSNQRLDDLISEWMKGERDLVCYFVIVEWLMEDESAEVVAGFVLLRK